jgi:diguanylate cyclase (GGDEF)-like protein/putative nucleotidyltransferase with HDIG domain
VSEVALSLGGGVGPESSLRAIADAARRALDADRAGCWVLTQEHAIEAVHTTETDPIRHAVLASAVGASPDDLPLLRRLITAPDPLLVVEDPSRHPDLGGDLAAQLDLGTVLAVRLEHGSVGSGDLLGVLLASYRRRRAFSARDRATARSLANLATLALANARLHQETLEALTTAELRAETDPLTGVLNRRGLDNRLDLALDAACEVGRPVSVLVIDLDNFKLLNERGGRHTGDAALKGIASLLENERRSSDVVGRFGGEEFVVILPDTGTEGAWLVAERLRAALARMNLSEALSVTASLGIATFPTHGTTSGDLLRAADSAMYVAKSLGRNCSVIFNPRSAAEHTELSRLATAGHEGYLGSVLALASAVDARDPSTHAHSATVARYAAAIAARLGLDADLVERVRIGGLLHDVGKVGVPDSILMKPDRLTPEEWTEMRRHPEIGARIIASPGLADVREWVLRHHERPDGRGYPDGLGGDAIPLAARILSVADAYEAMTADRPYRRALTVSVARAELMDGRGRQFDADVVDAFLDYLDAQSTPGGAAGSRGAAGVPTAA